MSRGSTVDRIANLAMVRSVVPDVLALHGMLK
jgi:hypothetical protein